MNAALIEAASKTKSAELNAERSKQIGSGMRGDKIRTYREQDDMVTDHRTNKRASLKLILQGRIELLR